LPPHIRKGRHKVAIELTRSMVLELAPTVRVNCVCSGYILTPMQEAEYTPEMLRACQSKIPLGRLGRPQEVAALFAFLASDDAAFITGHYFVIDGGEIAGGWPASHEPSDDCYSLAMADGPAHPLGGFSSEHLLESAPHNHRTFAFARDQPGRVQRG
jgi:hypothetical protein